MIAELLARDPARVRLLRIVRSLSLPDSWIGAGFVRNAVWDELHGRAPSLDAGDVDVIWFDRDRADAAVDQSIERELSAIDGTVAWSVKNQARMHVRNSDAPYRSSTDAIRFWPETATAVAVRLRDDDTLEVAAPYGVTDLIVRPTPWFFGARHDVFLERVRRKGWFERWPLLRLGG